MKTFTDNAARMWTITIHVFAVKRVRALCGVDLYGLVDQEFQGLGKLLGDPCSLVDVLYCLCKDEADKTGVTDEQFGRAMAGDALEHATNAFLAELTDFFPDPRVRAGLTKIWEKSRTFRDLLMDQLTLTIDDIDVESEARRLIGSSGSSRESSASTPDPSRSGS